MVSHEVDKFQSCCRLLEEWGIPRANVMFFGDGVNDVSCLSGFPHSVVMENADESVKRHARYVAGSNNSDGVFEFLTRVFLP